MSAAPPLDRLETEVDAESFERHAPVDVDGTGVGATLRPRDEDALAAALPALGRLGLAAIPVGGGSHLGLGNAPARADVLLCCERLRGIDVYEPAEGVIHVRAGTPLGEVREKIAAQRWELPLDAPDASTLGGALARAALGPRSHGFGPARDAVLGLEVALATGERTRCGGRVVKNVTGYDLQKLYTGSLGALGVILSAWLRLRPTPERVGVFSLPEAPLEQASRLCIEASRRTTTRACALLVDDDPGTRIVVELAGDAASVGADAAWLAERGATEAPAAALDAVRGRQLAGPGLRFRLGVLPSRLAACAETLRGAGATLTAYPGLRAAWAQFAPGTAIDAAFDAATAATGEPVLCELAPPASKRGRDVFHGGEGSLPLVRALKQRFDPEGVLSPGRLAGHL